LRCLLRYLYTDELKIADEHLLEVMRKAKEIDLERVYNHTVQRALETISVHNAVSRFVKADEDGLGDLRTASLGFLTRNFRQVSGGGIVDGVAACRGEMLAEMVCVEANW
jgi:hypothetical protein